MIHSKPICGLMAGLVLSFHAFAQSRLFTMAEATNGITSTLAPQSIKQPSWEPGNDKFWQTVNKGQAWIKTDLAKNKTDTVVRLEQLNAVIKGQLKSLPTFKWMDEDYVYFVNDKDVEKGIL